MRMTSETTDPIGPTPLKKSYHPPYSKNPGVHPAKLGRSNLPRDPVTGNIVAGPNAGKHAATVQIRLAKRDISKAFETLGGVAGLVKWAKKNDRNMYAFYVYIWPRLLSAQALDEAAEKISQRPHIVAIENVIVDPVAGRTAQVIPNISASRDVSRDVSREADEAELVIRDGIAEQAQEAGLGEEEADWIAGELTEIPL
jgi:hypothetical protein